MKEINSILIVVALCFSLNGYAQIHTFPWDPSSITAEQKDFIDSCKKYSYDTLGNLLSGIDQRRLMLEGDYVELMEIDRAARTASIKYRKASEIEISARKQKVLQESNIREIIGNPLNNLKFTDLNGELFQTSDFKDKIVYLNFWFVGCQPCELERVKLNQLHEKYNENENVLFLSFSASREKKTRDHLKKKEFQLPVVIIDKQEKTEFSFIRSFPTNAILKDGKYELALAGLSEGTFLVIEETLDRLLQ